MDIEISQNGSCLIAALSGELDQHMADAIRGRMDYGLLQAGIKNMVFDFTEVSFMDSSGIGMLLNRYKQVRKFGGNLYLTGCNQNLFRLIKLSGLERIVLLRDSIEEAVLEANSQK